MMRKRRAQMLKRMMQQQPRGVAGGAMRETRLKMLRRRLAAGRRMLEDMQERLDGLEEVIAGAEGENAPHARRGRAGIRSTAAAAMTDDDDEDDDEQDEGFGYGRRGYGAQGRFTSLRDLQERKVEQRRALRADVDEDDDEEDEHDEGEPRRGPLAALRGLRRKAGSRSSRAEADEADEDEEEVDDDDVPADDVLAEVFDELEGGDRAEFAEGYPRAAALRERLEARGAHVPSERRLRAAYDRWRQQARGVEAVGPREVTLFRVFRSLEGRNTAFTRAGTPKVDDVNIILDFLGEPDTTREEIDEVFEKYRAP